MTIDRYITSNVFLQECDKKANILLTKYRERNLDAADLIQEALTEVWSKRQQHNPQLASITTYVSNVAEWAMQKLIRNCYRHRSKLNKLLQECVASQDYRQANVNLDSDIAIDTQTILGRLPPDYQELYNEIGRHSITEIAANKGCHRNKITRKIATIRNIFIEAGLTEY